MRQKIPYLSNNCKNRINNYQIKLKNIMYKLMN